MSRPDGRRARVAWLVVARARGIDGAWLRARGVAKSLAYHLAAGRTVPGPAVLAMLPEVVVIAWVRAMRKP